MSLNFDLTNVVKPDDFFVPNPDFPDKQIYNFKYEVVIFPGTMLTGIGVLNDDTIPEFYARLNCYERLHGALCHGPDSRSGQMKPLLTTFETVLAMKGLKTNVYPMETRTKWVKRMVGQNFLDEVATQKKRVMTSEIAR